ncbi:proline-tRNA ligase [Cladophialophora carrionii CBS 160.54]|uniref:proline--tRNA ligase n=1 Tax=Cladophialophora carrionii CBS 160.54 TaxID=1279043 RepID=V9D511_9EURO|nr:proline-tRNA ligase [Cladophialophora carrionii CBS 160.54]ETI21097.1 proline-tRNA ligase [Cladophialophora carrionii CBS 160.54]
MKPRVGCWPRRRAVWRPSSLRLLGARHTHNDSRQRISDFWIPTVNVQKQDAATDATQLLIRAGFLRQAYAGIFQMLPLGLRVQEKLERLIDKHMRSVKASKVSLSSISSQALWEKSGRLKAGGEMFTFQDRKDVGWLLAPTHEEEITNLLAELIHTPQQLPIRLYQISRKYRDEKRPRGGLLRGREFLMKDLYTFDHNPEAAHITYDEIRNAYRSFLDELKIKYIEARATSGDMGGNLSHEYHFPNFAGEDTVITCSDCDYARNEEFVSQLPYKRELFNNVEDFLQNYSGQGEIPGGFLQEDFLSTDRLSLVRVITAKAFERASSREIATRTVNPYAVKAALNGILDIDTGVEDPLDHFKESLSDHLGHDGSKQRSVYYVLDSTVPAGLVPRSSVSEFLDAQVNHYAVRAPQNARMGANSLLKRESGDPCPQCKAGTLSIDKAIEIGHTFHLGTRYSSKLGLATKQEGGKQSTPVEMGCHGIGVSRLIAATASCLSDEVGLNWPRAIAPFEAVIVVQPSQDQRLQAAECLYDQLSATNLGGVDAILDDRNQGTGWKLKDADMIGYPVIVVIGKAFDKGKVEVQCRRLKVKQEVDIESTHDFVHRLLKQL